MEIGGRVVRKILSVGIAVGMLCSNANAQERRGTRLWNLTLYTLTKVQLSPAGQAAWGKNQCENDPDGTVDHNERVRITGIAAGRYDLKVADEIGRVCIVRNVEVEDGKMLTIEEKQLTECQK
jgi:hypothetical protein